MAAKPIVQIIFVGALASVTAVFGFPPPQFFLGFVMGVVGYHYFDQEDEEASVEELVPPAAQGGKQEFHMCGDNAGFFSTLNLVS